jgi:hypothetical protein
MPRARVSAWLHWSATVAHAAVAAVSRPSKNPGLSGVSIRLSIWIPVREGVALIDAFFDGEPDFEDQQPGFGHGGGDRRGDGETEQDGPADLAGRPRGDVLVQGGDAGLDSGNL